MTPRRPLLLATVIMIAAALTLCWPILTGQFMVGMDSDQLHAGYSFRHFAAEFFREHGRLPLWNPFLFGGLPFVGAAHGDIFYPTAWLRLVLPTDLAMSLGFAGHIVIAGVAMYGLLRGMRLSWAAAVVGGLGYELSGMVASQVNPGHDGKLFVSAMAPLLLLGILIAVRDRKVLGYAVIALTTGLALQGHPQTGAYLLIAAAVWGLFLVFGWEHGPKGAERGKVIAGAVGAVALGIGLYTIYALPMMEYIPYSPRSVPGSFSGWEYMTAYSMPPEELMGTILPQFDGMFRPTYFGKNGLKLHGEYLGPVVLGLALLGLGGPDRKRERRALGAIGILFLIVALGRYTPLYRIWYEVVPMMKKLRAPGMAFYLPSLVISVFAALGAERLFKGVAPIRRGLVGVGLIAAIGLLGAVGALQGAAEDMARSTGFQGFPEMAIANAGALQAGGLRLLLFGAAALAVLWLVHRKRLAGVAAVAAVGLLLLGDLWSIDRHYFRFSPPATELFGPDQAKTAIKETPYPYRVWVPGGRYAAADPYVAAWLMADQIPTTFGYHGNEIRFFDDLWGGKNDWQNQLNPNLQRLYGVRFALFNQAVELPGFHLVTGPVETALQEAYLYQADTIPPYAWVVRAAAKVPEDQLVPTVNDPRFPIDRLVVYPDTASLAPDALDGAPPEPSSVVATVSAWEPGRMTVTLDGSEPGPSYLLVAENWYPTWSATIDGNPAQVHRADNAVLSVELPAGAREVRFEFRSPSYVRGRAISLLSLAGVVALFGVAAARRGRERKA